MSKKHKKQKQVKSNIDVVWLKKDDNGNLVPRDRDYDESEVFDASEFLFVDEDQPESELFARTRKVIWAFDMLFCKNVGYAGAIEHIKWLAKENGNQNPKIMLLGMLQTLQESIYMMSAEMEEHWNEKFYGEKRFDKIGGDK